MSPIHDAAGATRDQDSSHWNDAPARGGAFDIQFTLNGVRRNARVGAATSALQLLREVIGMTGTKYGCGEGECGACTIIVDGRSVNSCLLFALDCDGRTLTTVEGLAGNVHAQALQQAFVAHGAVQCGFCTPGMMVQATHLLATHARPDDAAAKRAIEGNLCRCTGYQKIADAIVAAGESLAAGDPVNPIQKGPAAPESLIGQRIPKMDAPEKASGRTRYVHDIELPGQLHAAILRSARVHALITRIDTSAARALPGVHAVLTAADIADQRPIGVAKDHLPLKRDRVRSLRDEIAAVAADSEEIALQALRLIVVEYQDLPIIADAEAALAPGAALVHPPIAGAPAGAAVGLAGKSDNIAMRFDYSHGDLAQGEAESDVVVEDVFELHYVTHCCLGVSGVIAEFDARGNLLLYSNTQVPFLHKREFAEILNMDPGRIRIIQPPIGGGFGSKLDIYPFEVICVWLARATGRPVRLVFSREEEFLASPTRQPVRLTLRSGCTRDGRLTMRAVHTLHDNGAYTSWGATTPFVMMQTFSSLYRVPHCDYHTVAVYSNNPYAGSFRGYGNLQATFAVEAHMDRMAEQIGMDGLEFRLKNAQHSGEVTGQGMVFRSCGFQDCLRSVAERSDFQAKQRAYAARRDANGPIKRGIGVASMLHVGGGAKIYPSDGCGTMLKLDDFGHLTLITGASEIGQGSETVLAQLVCEELGLPISAVTVINNDTDITPWDVGVHASRTTFIAGNSAIGAARKARGKILAAAGARFDCPADTLELRGGCIVRAADGEVLSDLARFLRGLHFSERAELVMTSFYYEPPSVHQDKGFKGDVSAAYAWAAQVVEVEVDTDTGVVRMTRVTAAHDVGRVLNRLGIEGQIEGGIVMGQGYALTENLMVEGGRIRNPSFRDYKLVTAPEIPQMDIAFIESMDGEGPQGAKGVGEAPAICVAAATANAIYNATGVRITSLPFSPERVYRALHGALPAQRATPRLSP